MGSRSTRTEKPGTIKVDKHRTFGAQGSAMANQYRVSLHGRFLKSGSRASGWFQVHNGSCSTGRLNWTASPGR